MARRAARRCLLLIAAAAARRPTPLRFNTVRGGADDSFDEKVGAAFVAAAQASESETSKAAQSIDEGKAVEGLGDILGSAYDKALAAFDAQAPANSGEDRARQVAMQVTGAVQWRPPGVAYKKNEVYLDIVESVSLLMSHEGAVLRSSATGVIQMRCLLSGMPELKIGLNDTLGMGGANQAREASGPRGEGPSSGGDGDPPPRSSAGGSRAGRKQIELADLQFHQCVNLSKFSAERTISFVPPDGEFELMKYRVTEAVSLPFKVMPMVKELGRTRMEVRVRVKACFPETQMALGVKLRIPVPRHTSRATCKGTAGKCKYKQAENALVWKIKRFQGGCELSLHAEVDLISTTEEKKKWTQPPLSMDFSVPMFTASGLRVRFLKVWEKSGYQSTKWVRYLCNSGAESKGGTYEIRCQ